MEKAKTQTERHSFLRSRRNEPAAKKEETLISESFLHNSFENQASHHKDERQLVESHPLGTQDNIFGDLTQPRRLDQNSLGGYHPKSKFALLASAAAVLSSTGQQQQQQLPHSPMIKSSTIPAAMLDGDSHDSIVSIMSNNLNPRMSGIVHNGAAFKKDRSKRNREARQMRQMSRHEISVDDPFMTNNVNIGTQQMVNNNLMQEMESWGSEHYPWWH